MYNETFEDSYNLLCGNKIGQGISRIVFNCRLLPDYVVKVEENSDRFQNILEWTIWQDVVGTPASRWFAECKWISPNGRILIQEKTRPPASHEFLEKIPVWFTDNKKSNWGMAKANKDGKDFLVCHDYGVSLIVSLGTFTKRLRSAEWSE